MLFCVVAWVGDGWDGRLRDRIEGLRIEKWESRNRSEEGEVQKGRYKIDYNWRWSGLTIQNSYSELRGCRRRSMASDQQKLPRS